jgi:hypothetical protein
MTGQHRSRACPGTGKAKAVDHAKFVKLRLNQEIMQQNNKSQALMIANHWLASLALPLCLASATLLGSGAARSEVVISNSPNRTNGGSLVANPTTLIPAPKWLMFTTGQIPSQIDSLTLGLNPFSIATPLPLTTSLGLALWSTTTASPVPLPQSALTTIVPIDFTIASTKGLYTFNPSELGSVGSFTLQPSTTYGLALSGFSTIPLEKQPKWGSTGNTADGLRTAPSGENGFRYEGFVITKIDGSICTVKDNSDDNCGVPWNSVVVDVKLLGITPGMTTNASNPVSDLFSGGTVIVDQPGPFTTNYTLGALGGTIDSAGQTSTFSGIFSGPGPLTVTNTGSGGRLSLSGTSSYTGSTTVGHGATLAVNGSIASSSGLTVQSGGTIAGSGILPTTTIQSGGMLAPGNSIGTLTVDGALTLASGAISNFEVNGSAADQLVATGPINLAGTLNLAFSGSGYDVLNPYILFSGSSISGAFSSINATGDLLGYRYAVATTASNVALSLSKILASGMTTPITAPWSTTLAGGTLTIDAAGTDATNWLLDTPTGATSNTIDQNGSFATLSGNISGAGNLNFTNTGSGGRLSLAGTSSYTGSTAVGNGATLAVNGSIASSSGLTVQSGGTIAGSGTLPTTTIQSGGMLAPGNSIGTLTVDGNLSLNGGRLASDIQGLRTTALL